MYCKCDGETTFINAVASLCNLHVGKWEVLSEKEENLDFSKQEKEIIDLYSESKYLDCELESVFLSSSTGGREMRRMG